MSTDDMAYERPAATTSPSPSQRMLASKPVPVRFTSTTPAMPSAHPTILRPVRRSCLKSRVATSIEKKVLSETRMADFTPEVLETPM